MNDIKIACGSCGYLGSFEEMNKHMVVHNDERLTNRINEALRTKWHSEQIDAIRKLIKKEEANLLDQILENGHGGGNWRRLIMLERSILDDV